MNREGLAIIAASVLFGAGLAFLGTVYPFDGGKPHVDPDNFCLKFDCEGALDMGTHRHHQHEHAVDQVPHSMALMAGGFRKDSRPIAAIE